MHIKYNLNYVYIIYNLNHAYIVLNDICSVFPSALNCFKKLEINFYCLKKNVLSLCYQLNVFASNSGFLILLTFQPNVIDI